MGEVKKAVMHALQNGYKHIDCAAIYGNEEEIGEAFDEIFNNFDKYGIKREDIFVTTKLWNTNHGGLDRVELGLETSLKHLKLDYIDLYLMHWPVGFNLKEMPKEGLRVKDEATGKLVWHPDLKFFEEYIETWESLVALKKKHPGKVKSIGVSNFTVHKLKTIIEKSGVTPAVNQVECHPYLRQPELKQFCQEKNILITAYSPLGAPGRPGYEHSDLPILLKDKTIGDISEKLQCTPANVLIRWGIAEKCVVIAKSIKTERIDSNLKSLEINLSTEDVEAINKLDCNTRFVGGFLGDKQFKDE